MEYHFSLQVKCPFYPSLPYLCSLQSRAQARSNGPMAALRTLIPSIKVFSVQICQISRISQIINMHSTAAFAQPSFAKEDQTDVFGTKSIRNSARIPYWNQTEISKYISSRTFVHMTGTDVASHMVWLCKHGERQVVQLSTSNVYRLLPLDVCIENALVL